MQIHVNGMEETTPDGTTVADVKNLLGEHGTDLIIEVNNRFVFPGAYDSMILKEGDKIEFIHADLGG